MTAIVARLREALRLLAALRAAGPAALSLLVVLRTAQALVPAVTAVAMGVLLAALGTGGDRLGDVAPVVAPLAGLGAVLLVGQTIGTLVAPLEILTKGRVDGAHRARVATLMVSTETLATVERQDVQDLVRAARAESREWVERTPGDAALAQLRLVIRWVGMASTSMVVAVYSVWLVPMLIIPALVVSRIGRRHMLRHFRIWLRGMGHHRRSAYWAKIATSPAEAKEARIFGFSDWIVDRRLHHTEAHLGPVWADDRRGVRSLLVQLVCAAVPLAVVFYLVADATARGHGSVAQEAAVLTASWAVFATIIGTEEAFAMEGGRPAVQAGERLAAVLAPEATTRPPAAEDGRPAGPPPLVRLENIGFTYPGTARAVLDGVDLELRPGELVAIVGLNGAGKSTLTKVLAGLYQPTAGRVTIDGTDLREPGMIGAWRQRLTVVFQDFVRYHLTAAENVTLGAAGVRPERRDQAAAEAGLDGVITGLPAGWDTPLARTRTGGVDLSGGQWQQVALARALYAVRSGARVLVLDEPTAHLDVRTEWHLFQRLRGQTPDITVVLISHRLATVRQADRIVLLADGRIAESGDHDELMRLDGRYAEMFRIQAQQFTTEVTHP